jgi:hypothetical protein
VLKKAVIVAGTTTGLLALAPAAYADSTDNDGVNILNDNNISIAPVQLCDTDVVGLGVVVPVLSPQHTQCVNAPLVDHPSADS